MTLDEFLIERLDAKLFGKPYFYFWIKIVREAMELLGPETDCDLSRMDRLLEEYYTTNTVPAAKIDDIPHEIVRVRGVRFSSDTTPLGLKYRCLNAISSSVEKNLADLYYWQYGIVTAFQLINLSQDKDQILIERIQDGLSNYRSGSPE